MRVGECNRHTSQPKPREERSLTAKRKLYIRNEKVWRNRKVISRKPIQQSSTKDLIMADNQQGVQTRSMMDAQCNNPEQLQVPENNPTPAAGDPTPTPNLDPQNPALNPVVELTGIETDNLTEYVRTSSETNLDWYVPDLMNTHVKDMIKNRLPTRTSRNHITVTYPMLKDFLSTSMFEIDLRTGKVFTFQTPPEDIRVSCQQEEFNLDLLRK